MEILVTSLIDMNSEQKKIYKKVDEILWNDWDPIGVNDVAPRDEYQMYIPEIFKMLIENKTETEIAERLNDIAINTMGLIGNLEHCEIIAKKLTENK